MVVSSMIIMPLFLVAFGLICYQYYRVDPKRRVLNLRFGLMATASIGAISYPFVKYLYRHSPLLPPMSEGYLLVALFCFVVGFFLLRRMPPIDQP